MMFKLDILSFFFHHFSVQYILPIFLDSLGSNDTNGGTNKLFRFYK